MEPNNPYEEVLGNVGGFSPEDLKRAEIVESAANLTTQNNQQELQNSEDGVVDATAQDDPQKKQEEQRRLTLKDMQKGVEKTLDLANQGRELFQSPAAGLMDFGIDFLNAFPKRREMESIYQKNRSGLIPVDNEGNIKRLPKFKNPIAQAFRDIASFVVPNVLLGRGVSSAVGAAKLPTFAKDPLVQLLGSTALSAGVGAGVDFTNINSKEGDNLGGTLKKASPELFWWIPNSIATLDSDSPDIKRAKSVQEGAILGPFTDLLLGASTIVRGVKGMMGINSKFIPENETAKAFWKNPAQHADKTKTELAKSPLDVQALSKAETGNEMLALLGKSEEAVEQSAKARADALDELGSYNSYMDPTLDQPMLGVHDVFEPTETAIRSVDPHGVHGAAVDAARIQNNIGTSYGRLGSIITEAALKHGLDGDSIIRRDFINMIKESLQEGGDYSYKGLIHVSSKQIKDAGENLASVLVDPRMDVTNMRAILEDYRNEMEGIKVLDKAGYQGVFKAMKAYTDEYFNLDTLKAQAYLAHSLSGQVSDMAEGMRLVDGTDAVERAQEQIIDRLTYLFAEKGLTSKLGGSNLRNMRMWKAVKNADPKDGKAAVEAMHEEARDALSDTVRRARDYRDTLNNIRKDNPEFLKPLMFVNELTDGNVDSMYKLNNWVANKLGLLNKAFIDGQPEIPSEVMKGIWGNYYNSILSAFATPFKAAYSSAALLLEKPVAVIAGAAIGKDMKTMRRGWYQYSAVMDTLSKGFNHMGLVFRKASADPNSVPYIIRDDIAVKNKDTIQTLKMYASAAAENGEFGPQIMVDLAENLNALSEHPWLRFSVNAMSAMDGFTRAVIANAEARGKAFDDMLESSGGKIDGAVLKKASNDYYNSMFDSTGFITDEAVEYATREVAMSLDSPVVNAMSGAIARYPMLKPWMMFPRTSVNILSSFWNQSLLSAFVGDYNKIIGHEGKNHTVGEIKEILQARNIPFDDFALPRFRSLQAEIKGRVAIGTTVTSMATFMFMNDRLRGNGHFDKARQQQRLKMGWKPKTFKALDGKWYSYGEIGPLADWLATTADVMDNFDLLSVAQFEEFRRKTGFILGAALFNRSTLATLEPLMDILSGNPVASNRWAATMVSGFMPLSGQRNELGRLLYPELRIMDQEFGELLRNRNNFLDGLDPAGALPVAYDYIDGTPINKPEGFFSRLMHAYLPTKVYEDISPERQFMIDIEYDAQPTFMKSSDGSVRYTPRQRAELFSLVGKHQHFHDKLVEIKRDADKLKMVESLRRARKNNLTSDQESLEEFGGIYRRIDRALTEAKRMAEAELSDRAVIQQEATDMRSRDYTNRQGLLNSDVLDLTNK